MGNPFLLRYLAIKTAYVAINKLENAKIKKWWPWHSLNSGFPQFPYLLEEGDDENRVFNLFTYTRYIHICFLILCLILPVIYATTFKI